MESKWITHTADNEEPDCQKCDHTSPTTLTVAGSVGRIEAGKGIRGRSARRIMETVKAEEPEIRKRCCCNCGNNIRVKDDKGMVDHNECAIDGHYIGYVECFEHWCRRWRKGR